MFVKLFWCIFFMVLICTPGFILAQQDTSLNREVEVIKSFQPTISDANKISSMPRVEDVPQEKPSFSYSIFSQPIYNTFSVNPLKAATFVSESKDDTGYGFVRAGVGNYNRPYGEIFFNSQNLKNTLFGLHGRHLSSHSKIKLDGSDRVNAAYSDNDGEMFLKHLYRNSVLAITLGFNHDGFNYYGYPENPIPDVLKESGQEINYQGDRQTFTKGTFNINLENVASRKDDFTFDFDFLYHYFGTKTGQREHLARFIADIKKPTYEGAAFLKAGLTYVTASEIADEYMYSFGRNQLDSGLNNQTVFTIQPSYKLGGDVANIQFGFRSWLIFDSSTDLAAKLAPVVRVNFIPVKELINIYAGVDGNFIHNHYSKIAYENPFVDPQHLVKNSFERFRFYGGFDGKLASKTNFKLSVDYSVMRDNPLYYLYRYQSAEEPETIIVDNDFDVFYDNFNRLKFNLELFHVAYDKMEMVLGGNYYVYKMESMDEPWNLPSWDAKLSLGYKISDQLRVSTDMFLTGHRTGLIMSLPGADPRPMLHSEMLVSEDLMMEPYTLSTIFDLNFNANYKITNRFSAFAQLNNFGFQQYQKWLGYPVQSFNIMGGLSYAF